MDWPFSSDVFHVISKHLDSRSISSISKLNWAIRRYIKEHYGVILFLVNMRAQETFTDLIKQFGLGSRLSTPSLETLAFIYRNDIIDNGADYNNVLNHVISNEKIPSNLWQKIKAPVYEFINSEPSIDVQSLYKTAINYENYDFIVLFNSVLKGRLSDDEYNAMINATFRYTINCLGGDLYKKLFVDYKGVIKINSIGKMDVEKVLKTQFNLHTIDKLFFMYPDLIDDRVNIFYHMINNHNFENGRYFKVATCVFETVEGALNGNYKGVIDMCIKRNNLRLASYIYERHNVGFSRAEIAEIIIISTGLNQIDLIKGIKAADPGLFEQALGDVKPGLRIVFDKDIFDLVYIEDPDLGVYESALSRGNIRLLLNIYEERRPDLSSLSPSIYLHYIMKEWDRIPEAGLYVMLDYSININQKVRVREIIEYMILGESTGPAMPNYGVDLNRILYLILSKQAFYALSILFRVVGKYDGGDIDLPTKVSTANLTYFKWLILNGRVEIGRAAEILMNSIYNGALVLGSGDLNGLKSVFKYKLGPIITEETRNSIGMHVWRVLNGHI